MKNFYSALLFGLFITNIFSQTPSIEWQKCLGGTNSEEISNITQTLDGGYISFGYSTSINGDITGNHGGYDAWVVKVNSSGNIEWQKAYGGTGDEVGGNIIQLSDGSYIFSARTNSNNGDVSGNHGQEDIWVVKLNTSGDIMWQKTFGGSLGDYLSEIKTTTDGGFILCGSTYSNDNDVSGNHGGLDFWVVKINSVGDLIWQKTLGGTSNEEGNSIAQTIDLGYIITGYTQSNNGDVSNFNGIKDIWVVKLDSSGNIVWEKTLGGTNDENSFSVQQISDGSYVVCGYTNSNDIDVTINQGNSDGWIVKLNNIGIIQWQKTAGGTDSDWFFKVIESSDGSFIVAGRTQSNNGDIIGNHGGLDGNIMKLNSSGDIQWQKSIGGSLDDHLYSIEKTSDNGYILCGLSQSNDGDVSGNHGGGSDGWIVKLSSETLSTDDFETINFKVYPNPVSNFLHISSDIIINQNIKIFDISGRQIKNTSINNELIDVSTLNNGFYILQVETNDNNIIKKKFIKQ